MPTSSHKTTIDTTTIQQFLTEKFQTDNLIDVVHIAGGEGSQAFGYTINNTNYVIRVNKHSDRGFAKDHYAYSHFNSDRLPIPEVIEIGTLDNGNYYAISIAAKGVQFKNLDIIDQKYLLPKLFDILNTIHTTDISATTGYGKWDHHGLATYSSWKSMLLNVDMYAKDLFDTTFLEKSQWDISYNKFLELLPFCPEDRYLVHGDYSSDNIITTPTTVTAILDWETAMYGDYLYDVAWMQFFSKGINYEQAFLEYHHATSILHFTERVLCYQLYIGMSSLSFYAYSGQREKYDGTVEKLNTLLKKIMHQ